MTDRTLPHDPYITAVCDALTSARLIPADAFTEDTDSRGTYCYLRAVITLDADTSGLDPARFRHGLLLIWEWHTGAEADAGESERGPSWAWQKGRRDGSFTEPQTLTADGYANPTVVADAARTLAAGSETPWPDRWEHAHTLDTACQAWAATEAGQ